MQTSGSMTSWLVLKSAHEWLVLKRPVTFTNLYQQALRYGIYPNKEITSG